jgi:hypothetical protein
MIADDDLTSTPQPKPFEERTEATQVGEMLLEKFLQPLKLSQREFSGLHHDTVGGQDGHCDRAE